MLSEKIRKLEKNGYQFYDTGTFVVKQPLFSITEDGLLENEYAIDLERKIAEEAVWQTLSLNFH